MASAAATPTVLATLVPSALRLAVGVGDSSWGCPSYAWSCDLLLGNLTGLSRVPQRSAVALDRPGRIGEAGYGYEAGNRCRGSPVRSPSGGGRLRFALGQGSSNRHLDLFSGIRAAGWPHRPRVRPTVGFSDCAAEPPLTLAVPRRSQDSCTLREIDRIGSAFINSSFRGRDNYRLQSDRRTSVKSPVLGEPPGHAFVPGFLSLGATLRS